MENVKPWWESRTLWFNTIAGLLPVILDNIAMLEGLMPANIYAIFFFIAVVGNAFLRTKTNQGLALK